MRGERRARELFTVMGNREIGQKLKKDVTVRKGMFFVCVYIS